MGDAIYLLLIVGLAGLSWGLMHLCSAVQGE